MNEILSVTNALHIIETQIDKNFENRRKKVEKSTPANTDRFRTVASTLRKI